MDKDNVRPGGLSSCGSSQQAVSPVPASIPDAGYLKIGPRDVVVFSYPESLTDDQFKRLKKEMSDALDQSGIKQPRMLLEGGITVSVLQVESAQAIDARSDETGTGSARQGESAVAESDASNA